MMARTHIVFALFLALLFTLFFSSPLSHPFVHPFLFLAFLFLLLFSALLPDLDHPRSYLSQKIPLLPSLLRFVFGHRGFVHSLWAAFLFFLILLFWQKALAWAVLIGYLSHLFADALTQEGLNFLAPFASFRIQGFIRTGSFLETVFLGVIVLADFLLIIRII